LRVFLRLCIAGVIENGNLFTGFTGEECEDIEFSRKLLAFYLVCFGNIFLFLETTLGCF